MLKKGAPIEDVKPGYGVAMGGYGGDSLNAQVIFSCCSKVKSLKSSQECISLETWVLPITVVVAGVAYAVLAAVFYNTNIV